MTNYSDNPGMVRVDYYKPNGKWYMTESIDMTGYWDEVSIHTAVASAISDSRGGEGGRLLSHFVAVVQEPYHRNAYPIMLIPMTRDVR